MKKFYQFSLLSLALASAVASAEVDPRPKVLDLYYNGKMPTLSQMLSIRVGRCYAVDAKEIRTLSGLYVGKSPQGLNGPLFEESDLVKFWAFSSENTQEYDNFPAKDFLNGNYSLSRSYDFESLTTSASRSQNAWTQLQTQYGNGSYTDRTDSIFRVNTNKVMRARMNGKYLVTAYGSDYIDYAGKERCTGFFDRYCNYQKTDKIVKQGFDIKEICYFYNRID